MLYQLFVLHSSLGQGHRVLTSYAFGPCGKGDSPSMPSYRCADGLKCVTKPHMTGAYGVCERAASPVISYEGGPCCNSGAQCRTDYRCADGLQCAYLGVRGPYGQCERPSPSVSSEGGPCGKGDSPEMTDYECAMGLTCIPVYIPGHYGYCKKVIHWSSDGQPCGQSGLLNGEASHQEYRCKDDLVCHVSVQGHYGRCQRPRHHHMGPSPSPRPVNPPSDLTGTVCGNFGGSAGNIRCPSGLNCYGANPATGAYGTCQYPGFGGRRLEPSESEFEPEQLEAPLDEE